MENPQQKRILEETKVLIDKLLLERVSLARIARVCDVSERWLQSYVNHLYASVDQHVKGEKGAADPPVRRTVELRRQQAPGSVGLDRT